MNVRRLLARATLDYELTTEQVGEATRAVLEGWNMLKEKGVANLPFAFDITPEGVGKYLAQLHYGPKPELTAGWLIGTHNHLRQYAGLPFGEIPSQVVLEGTMPAGPWAVVFNRLDEEAMRELMDSAKPVNGVYLLDRTIHIPVGSPKRQMVRGRDGYESRRMQSMMTLSLSLGPSSP